MLKQVVDRERELVEAGGDLALERRRAGVHGKLAVDAEIERSFEQARDQDPVPVADVGLHDGGPRPLDEGVLFNQARVVGEHRHLRPGGSV